MANKRTLLDDDDTLVRHIPKNRLRVDGETNQVVGILPQAFALRPATATKPKEEWLSSWFLETFGRSCPANVFDCVNNAREQRDCRRGDAFATANVAELRETCRLHGALVKITHEPNAKDKAYATIRDYDACEQAMLEAIASGPWRNLILNAEVPARVVCPKL